MDGPFQLPKWRWLSVVTMGVIEWTDRRELCAEINTERDEGPDGKSCVEGLGNGWTEAIVTRVVFTEGSEK